MNGKKTLLLVEDEVVISLHEASELKTYGYEVLTAAGAEAAIDTVKNNSIDLILMDIDLGDNRMDGTEAAGIILKEYDIPIVFLSSHTEPEVVEKTEKITSYGYIVKNSSITVLDASIKMAFKLFDAKVKELEKEEVLRKSESKLQSILENSMDWIWAIDLSGRHTYSNHMLTEILGYTPEEFVGKEYLSLIHEDDRQNLNRIRDRHISEKSGWKGLVLRWRHKGGTYRCLESKAKPIINSTGTVVGFSGVDRDITEYKSSEDKLRESESFLNSIVENIPFNIFIKDAEELSYVLFNKAAAEIFRFSRGELIGKKDSDIFSKDEADILIKQDREALKTGILLDIPENILHSRDGTEKILHTKKIPLYDELGNPQYLLGISEDITERKKAEKTLKEITDRFNQSARQSRTYVWEVNTEGCYTYVSPTVEEVLGYSPEEMVGRMYFFDLHPEDEREEFKLNAFKVFHRKDSFNNLESCGHSKDGRLIWISTNGIPMLDDEGLLLGYRGSDIDITDRKQAEFKIASLLTEKETLLKEVHHRIKNNMAQMCVLLDQQSKSNKSPEALSVCNDAIARIKAMGVLYDKLYSTESYKDVSIKEYFSLLIDEIVQIFPDKQKIEIKKQFDEFTIGTEVIFPLGIIVNELLTNAVKYAFDGRDSGFIKISASKNVNQVTIIFEDNGVGIPEIRDVKEQKGFGLKLIELLVKQIGGGFRIERNNGTKFIIEFEIYTPQLLPNNP